MSTTKKPFLFHSLANGLPETREALHSLAFYAYHQFLSDGGKVTVGRPAFATGCEIPSATRQMIRAGR